MEFLTKNWRLKLMSLLLSMLLWLVLHYNRPAAKGPARRKPAAAARAIPTPRPPALP